MGKVTAPPEIAASITSSATSRSLRAAWVVMEREVNAASHMHGSMDWQRRAAEVEAAVRADERAKLRPWLRHLSPCVPETGAHAPSCSCGLDAALEDR